MFSKVPVWDSVKALFRRSIVVVVALAKVVLISFVIVFFMVNNLFHNNFCDFSLHPLRGALGYSMPLWGVYCIGGICGFYRGFRLPFSDLVLFCRVSSLNLTSLLYHSVSRLSIDKTTKHKNFFSTFFVQVAQMVEVGNLC